MYTMCVRFFNSARQGKKISNRAGLAWTHRDSLGLTWTLAFGHAENAKFLVSLGVRGRPLTTFCVLKRS